MTMVQNYSIGYIVLFIIFISHYMPALGQEVQKKTDKKSVCFCLSHPETKNILYFDCSEVIFPNKYTPKVFCKKCGPEKVTHETVKDAQKFKKIIGSDTGLCAPCQLPKRLCEIGTKKIDTQRNDEK